MLTIRTTVLALSMSASLATGALAQGDTSKFGYPLKHKPRPTVPAITKEDLMTRLYIYADDSMQGRQVGHEGNYKATSYIAGQLKLLGIEPGGENGTYFQKLLMVQRKFTAKSTLHAGANALAFNVDFVPVPGARAPKGIDNVPVIYGGDPANGGTLITPEQAAGKFVILASAPTAPAAAAAGGRGGAGGGRGGGGGGAGLTSALAMFPGALGVAIVDLDAMSPAARAAINNPAAVKLPDPPATVTPGDIVVTSGSKIGIVRKGALVSGALPQGRTAEAIQAAVDSAARVAAIAPLIASARRVDSTARSGGKPSCPPNSANCVAFTDEQGRVVATLDSATAAAVIATNAGRGGRGGAGGGRGGAAPAGNPVAALHLSQAAVQRIFGRPLSGLTAGTTGGTITAKLDFVEEEKGDWGRNVIGIIRGSDPALKGEFVAIGAHNDHIAMRPPGVDHDSLKAYNDITLALKMKQNLEPLTPAQQAMVRVNMDSIRKLHPKVRIDSISNGADDDGSGSMGVLEIAENLAKNPVKPKRSIIFVWHVGEEAGLWGSQFFAAHPTVPVDSIVTQINIDMIGRGRAEDIIGGGDSYLGAVGAGRLSADLKNAMLATNQRQAKPFSLDYRYDDPTLGVARSADGQVPWAGYNNIYGRSDHYNYAKDCIPIVFFFTGLHGDYHQLTDEPQYIDFPHYAAIDNFIRDLLVDIANRPVRPQLDNACPRLPFGG